MSKKFKPEKTAKFDPPKMVETSTSKIRRAQKYIRSLGGDPRAMPRTMKRANRLAEAAKLAKKLGRVGRRLPVVGAALTAVGLASEAYAAGKKMGKLQGRARQRAIARATDRAMDARAEIRRDQAKRFTYTVDGRKVSARNPTEARLKSAKKRKDTGK